jgi:multiple sugar transport system substrate-binding protein
MTSRKNFLKWMVVGLTGTGLLQACSSSATPTPTPVTGNVVIAVSKEFAPSLKPLVDEFNTTKSGVIAELRELEGTNTALKDNYSRLFARKDTSFDLLMVQSDWLPEFMAANWLLPLDNLFTTDEKNRHFEIALQQATGKGKLYALPFYSNAGVLYYRKDLLNEANLKPPQTFDELNDTALKLQKLDDGVFGFIYSAFPTIALSNNFLEILGGFGGELLTQDGKMAVNSEAGEKALNWWVDNIYSRKISPVQVTAWRTNDVQTIFSQGQSVFLQANSDIYPALSASGVKDKFEVAPLPAVTGQKPSGLLNSTYLAISANSKNPLASGRILQFLSSPASQKKFALATGNPPTHKDLYQDKDLLSKYPHFATLNTAMATARLRPATVAYPQISAEVLQPQLIRLLTEKATVKETLQFIADRAQPLVR